MRFLKVQWTSRGFKKRIINYYKTIDKYKNTYAIFSLCKLLNITRASYYRWYKKISQNTIIKIRYEFSL
ncbi:IS3 family transposase [Spiroplasma gladiatoris]|uniref:IS3 family transposase n=1 Tax=Spiroplasma gladiatoris TaxID=2143 RepID=A0A4P7AGK2_9MOLU|nr:hypothetical protein [Spiroplasma gladiatoris]QBQ07252.1 IS3 family transposase [Spiroplasma gladiatoris]